MPLLSSGTHAKRYMRRPKPIPENRVDCLFALYFPTEWSACIQVAVPFRKRATGYSDSNPVALKENM